MAPRTVVAVFLRVRIEGRLILAVTQDALHGLGFDLRLVHQPIGKRAAKIVKRWPSFDMHSGFLCGRVGLDVADQR